jgi:hypothetical protein
MKKQLTAMSLAAALAFSAGASASAQNLSAEMIASQTLIEADGYVIPLLLGFLMIAILGKTAIQMPT